MGIETSVFPTSPADSIALAPPPNCKKPTKTWILRPNCDQVLSQFVERHRLRVKRDASGDLIAPAKFGHLYAHTAGLIGLVLEDARNGQSRGRSLLARRRKALAAGFRLHQAGDAEAILLFELSNPAQEKLAIRLAGAKRRRIPSPAQLETLSRAREAFRFCKTPAQRPLQGVGTHEFRAARGMISISWEVARGGRRLDQLVRNATPRPHGSSFVL